jgi:hypothetical protein
LSSNFNLAFDVLNHLLGGNLKKPQSGYKTPLIGQMVLFKQEAFINPPSALTVDQSISLPLSQWISANMASYNPTNWGWPTSGLLNWTLPRMTTPFEANSPSMMTPASAAGFDNQGFVYFPSACATGAKCPIHVALHGCQQGLDRSYFYVLNRSSFFLFQ